MTGPILTVQSSGRPIFVVNAARCAQDLLDKGTNFASRPRWPMAELAGRQENVGFQYYGDALKRSRKVLRNGLSMAVLIKHWNELFDGSCTTLLQKFSSSPEVAYDSVHE